MRIHGNDRSGRNTDPSIEAARIYDEIAEKYTRLYFHSTVDEEIVKYFLELLPENARILDVGCGPGGDVKYFIEKGFRAEGIDISKKIIASAKTLVPEENSE